MRRLLLAAMVAAALYGALAFNALAPIRGVVPFAPTAATCDAAGAHRASIVVQHLDGRVLRRCVSFAGVSVSGEQLLKLSGIEYQVQPFGSFGDAICQVDSEPAGYTDCLGKDYYWAYFVSRSGGAWQFSNVGLSEVTLKEGDAEGFRYISTSGSPATPPSPAGICAPLPTPRPSLAAAPVVTASATARGTPTPAGSAPAARSPAVAAVGGATAVATATGGHAANQASPAATSPDAPAGPAGGDGGPDTGMLAAGIGGAVLLGLAGLRSLRRRRARL